MISARLAWSCFRACNLDESRAARHPRAHHLRRVLGEERTGGEGAAADPNYLDVSVAPGQRKRLKIETTRNAFAYVFVLWHLLRLVESTRGSDGAGREPRSP